MYQGESRQVAAPRPGHLDGSVLQVVSCQSAAHHPQYCHCGPDVPDVPDHSAFLPWDAGSVCHDHHETVRHLHNFHFLAPSVSWMPQDLVLLPVLLPLVFLAEMTVNLGSTARTT